MNRESGSAQLPSRLRLGCCLPLAVRRSMGIAKVPRQPSPPPASRRHPRRRGCRQNSPPGPHSGPIERPSPAPRVLECLMAGCRHGPEMGTHRGDGRWTAPAGGHTRSVSSLGSPGAVPGVVWAFERFSAGASDAARFALFQTKPGNPEEFFRLPAKELRKVHMPLKLLNHKSLV